MARILKIILLVDQSSM